MARRIGRPGASRARGALTGAVIGLGLLCLVPAGLAAQQPLPRFATCMDREMARFERALTRLRERDPGAEFEIGSTRGVGFCGSVGIVACDRSEAPIACQYRLAHEQEAWRAAVLDSLPAAVPGQGFPATLYPMALALTRDRSAGPDCAGATEAMAAWCAAWQANTRLRNAILPHLIARFLDASPRATALGWAQVPPPTRPRLRPERAQ